MLPIPGSDAWAVRRVLAGRPEAFETLVFRYQRKAHAIARAQGVPPSALDDVVQESFLRSYGNLASLESPSRFGVWFLQIVRNTSSRYLRNAAARTGLPSLTKTPSEIAGSRLRNESRGEEWCPGSCGVGNCGGIQRLPLASCSLGQGISPEERSSGGHLFRPRGQFLEVDQCLRVQLRSRAGTDSSPPGATPARSSRRTARRRRSRLPSIAPGSSGSSRSASSASPRAPARR
jgi:RNA polymerase sigma factor (sigma-70 family)